MKIKAKSYLVEVVVVVLALLPPDQNMFADAHGWGSGGCTGSSLHRRHYHYNRRHPRNVDLAGEIFSMPIYFNSLYRKLKEDVVNQILLPDDDYATESTSTAASATMEPRYTVSESMEDGSITLALEVPGVMAKDLVVELENGNVLRVKGTRFYNNREGDTTVESNFDKTFRIEESVDVENLKVKLSSGILQITMPKKVQDVKRLKIVTEDDDGGENIEHLIQAAKHVEGNEESDIKKE